MPVSLNFSDFSVNLFTLDQKNKPTDGVRFLEGLDALASRALDVLSQHKDVEQAFHQIERIDLLDLSDEDKDRIDQRIRAVFKNWVKVTFGSHSRHIPRKRLAEQCGPKFQAQYTTLMKEATDQELDLQSGDPSLIDGCPEDCKELFLVYLQTGVVSPGALGDNALNILVLAKQHQMEELTQECLDFLIDNLSIENLGTFLEFTQQTPFPPLEVACLNFMKDNKDSISEDLKTKHQEKLSIVEALARGEITLTISSSGKIEARLKAFTEQTVDLLEKISKQFPITSLILPRRNRNNLFKCLEQIALNLEHLQELLIWNETPMDNDLAKLKGLFPNLKALGNDAPFLNNFDEVRTYVENFRKPGEEGQESQKPLLRSLNLTAVPNLTDARVEELTPYLQELYYLSIRSDKITSLVAPKAATVSCRYCIALTTIEAPKATEVYCNDCTALTMLEAPEATKVCCKDCTALRTLNMPEAIKVYCFGCTVLTTLEAAEATYVDCAGCKALTILKAPEATWVDCYGCKALTTLEAPRAIWVDCGGCKMLATFPPLTANFVGESKFSRLIEILSNYLSTL